MIMNRAVPADISPDRGESPACPLLGRRASVLPRAARGRNGPMSDRMPPRRCPGRHTVLFETGGAGIVPHHAGKEIAR